MSECVCVYLQYILRLFVMWLVVRMVLRILGRIEQQGIGTHLGLG